MYQSMETILREQRQKSHDYKNHLGCLLGILKEKDYDGMSSYLNTIYRDWIEETDYFNTNNMIVNSVLNQKMKQARKKGMLKIK